MKNKKIIGAIFFNLGLALNPSLIRAEGIGLGNGGLSKKQADTSFELVEHVENGTCTPVDDNKALFQEVAPKLIERLSQISQAEPLLALALWRDLNDMHIRICPFPLEKIKGCPKPETKDEVVVGCRLSDGDKSFSNKVYLANLEQLKSHKRPEYVFIHEALHKIIPGNDEAHQQNLNEFSDYLYDNEGRLEKKRVRRLLVEEMKAGAIFYASGISYYQEKNTSAQSYEDVVSLIFGGNASDEALCSLFQFASAKEATKTPLGLLLISLASERYRWPLIPQNCDGAATLSEIAFKKLGKDFGNALNYLGTARPAYFSASNFDHDLYDCNWYITPEKLKKFRSEVWAWSVIKKARNLVFSDKPGLDDEEKILLRAYLDFFLNPSEGLPRFNEYISFGLCDIFSNQKVETECKESSSKLEDVLEAEKSCRERFSWDSQKSEWVEKSAKQTKSSRTSPPSNSSTPRAKSFWNIFRKS